MPLSYIIRVNVASRYFCFRCVCVVCVCIHVYVLGHVSLSKGKPLPWVIQKVTLALVPAQASSFPLGVDGLLIPCQTVWEFLN